MSAPNGTSNEELRELDVRAQAFIPEAAEHTPHRFLSLAPQTSNSYPKRPTGRRPSQSLSEGGLADVGATTEKAEDQVVAHKRRSSSLSTSSDGGAKSPARFRFLKLNPVHYGEHPDDHQADWHEVAVE
ncbi:hypothetical protein NKR23_g2704 [Pleurostoma richardsiae]|uniref:Uncharacterized protein n=1 Tax=Pleurostoma richardsiae TaxID=41990 RepID=A0AA38VUU8_9PEZI|nr:hypothetical protein NKR23_g2704 [Pleurostoma richardsiae]